MSNPTVDAFLKAKAFRELVSGTLAELKQAQTPASLASVIDNRVAAWETADPDFATVLRDLKGAAYSMTLPHVRAVAFRLCEHLQVNLDRIDAESRKRA